MLFYKIWSTFNKIYYKQLLVILSEFSNKKYCFYLNAEREKKYILLRFIITYSISIGEFHLKKKFSYDTVAEIFLGHDIVLTEKKRNFHATKLQSSI